VPLESLFMPFPVEVNFQQRIVESGGIAPWRKFIVYVPKKKIMCLEIAVELLL